MSWFLRCSWCGGPFNGGNCRRCTNVSFGDEFVRNPDPISNDETPDFSHPPSQPQTSSFDQFHCLGCGDPLEDGVRCQQCTASGVDIILAKDFVCFALQEMEIHPLMLLIRTLSIISQTFSPTFYNPSTNHTRVSYVGTILTTVMIVHHGSRLGPHESFRCQLMNQKYFEPNSNYFGFDQPPQYSIDHQEDLNQQRISDLHDRWDKIEESQNELLNMMQSFCEMVIQQKQAANIDQSPPQEMSIQDMEDLKQQYLDEMQSISNQIQIKDYHNERIDIRFRRECEITIDELKGTEAFYFIRYNSTRSLETEA
ncbi:hypothetical protein Tco_1245019 [Tanacetum coccineum]